MYKVLEEYGGNEVNHMMRHNKCGHEYSVRPSNFLFGKRCPKCRSSVGENLVEEYLLDNGIPFKREYSFEGLVGLGGLPLRFDFATFNKYNQLLMLVEYDGEFHFKDYYGDGKYEILVNHDNRKNQYCKNHNIKLLRIPYWERDNIENILRKELSL